MAYKDSGCDHYHAVIQVYNSGAETHLGGGDTSVLSCHRLPLVERSLTFVASIYSSY